MSAPSSARPSSSAADVDQINRELETINTSGTPDRIKGGYPYPHPNEGFYGDYTQEDLGFSAAKILKDHHNMVGTADPTLADTSIKVTSTWSKNYTEEKKEIEPK